jgi:NUMOD4 motif
MIEEIWKPIEGWENYQISTHGRIRSMRRWVGSNTGQRLVGGSFRKTVVLPNGKLTVTISDGHSKTFCVDVLVARHFLLNPNGYKNVQHRDGNQLNCHINNLQWSPKRARAQPAHQAQPAERRTVPAVAIDRYFPALAPTLISVGSADTAASRLIKLMLATKTPRRRWWECDQTGQQANILIRRSPQNIRFPPPPLGSGLIYQSGKAKSAVVPA